MRGRPRANLIEGQDQHAGSGLGSSEVSIGVQPAGSISWQWRSPLSGARVRSESRTGADSWLLAFAAVASLASAAIVAYAAAVNPDAVPAGPAGWLARAAYVLAPAVAGIYAWRLHPEERLGRLLVVFAAAAALWTLNGSADPVLFGVARLVGVFVAPLLSYVVLSFPEGWLHSRLEAWVVDGQRRRDRGVLGPAGVHHRAAGDRHAAGSLRAPLPSQRVPSSASRLVGAGAGGRGSLRLCGDAGRRRIPVTRAAARFDRADATDARCRCWSRRSFMRRRWLCIWPPSRGPRPRPRSAAGS